MIQIKSWYVEHACPRIRDPNVESKHMDSKEEGRGGMNWEIEIDI